jgi:transposase-like protein
LSEITYDFVCPNCGHSHFEAIGGKGRMFRCFSCVQTFTKEQLREFAEEKLHPNQKRIKVQTVPSTEKERIKLYRKEYRKNHREQCNKNNRIYRAKKKMLNGV